MSRGESRSGSILREVNCLTSPPTSPFIRSTTCDWTNFQARHEPQRADTRRHTNQLSASAAQTLVSWSGEFLHPAQNLPVYGADIAIDSAVAALRLMLDDSPQAKRPGLAAMSCQIGNGCTIFAPCRSVGPEVLPLVASRRHARGGGAASAFPNLTFAEGD
jgi:hypothetical protein